MKKSLFTILVFSIFFFTTNVYAKPKSTLIYANNNLMNTNTRIFISSNTNVNISIRPASNSVIDDDAPQYGYVAVCSALGSFNDRYVSTVSSNVLTDMSVVNSTVGCTIPGTSAYANLSFVKYYTFKIPWSNWNCSAQGTTCFWNNNLDFAYYQPNTDEISIISYGFQNEPYNFNNTVNPTYWQNETIINNQNSNTNTIINNQNSNTQSIIDNQNSNTQAITGSLNDDNVNDAERGASDFFSNFNTDTHGLTGIITAPLSAIESLTSATCSPLILPLPFIDEDLNLPCMRSIYENFFGDFMDIYDIVVLGVLSYWIMVRIFAMVKDFKNPEHDEVEVMEL